MSERGDNMEERVQRLEEETRRLDREVGVVGADAKAARHIAESAQRDAHEARSSTTTLATALHQTLNDVASRIHERLDKQDGVLEALHESDRKRAVREDAEAEQAKSRKERRESIAKSLGFYLGLPALIAGLVTPLHAFGAWLHRVVAKLFH